MYVQCVYIHIYIYTYICRHNNTCLYVVWKALILVAQWEVVLDFSWFFILFHTGISQCSKPANFFWLIPAIVPAKHVSKPNIASEFHDVHKLSQPHQLSHRKKAKKRGFGYPPNAHITLFLAAFVMAGRLLWLNVTADVLPSDEAWAQFCFWAGLNPLVFLDVAVGRQAVCGLPKLRFRKINLILIWFDQ